MPFNPDDFVDTEDLETLAQINLKSFQATPSTIGPFGASELAWDIEGPDRKFTVLLGRDRVAKKGSKVVRPKRTTTFRLKAQVGLVSKPLGTATVTVNLEGCESVELRNPTGIAAGLLQEVIEQDPDLYFRSRLGGFGSLPEPSLPIVMLEGSRIRFRLALKQRLDNKPDPSVDIDAVFGLDVVGGELVPISEDIDVEISVPPYVWLIPGAAIFVPILLSNGRQTARAGAQEMIQGIVGLYSFLLPVPPGMTRKSVQLLTDETGDNYLELTWCPDRVEVVPVPPVVE